MPERGLRVGIRCPQCVLSNLFQIGLLAWRQRVFINGFGIVRHGVDKFFAFFIPIFFAAVVLTAEVCLIDHVGRIRVGNLWLKIRTVAVQVKIEGDPLCRIDFCVVEEVGNFLIVEAGLQIQRRFPRRLRGLFPGSKRGRPLHTF